MPLPPDLNHDKLGEVALAFLGLTLPQLMALKAQGAV